MPKQLNKGFCTPKILVILYLWAQNEDTIKSESKIRKALIIWEKDKEQERKEKKERRGILFV